MEQLVKILGSYGAWGLLLVVLLYILLQAKIIFIYPRSKGKRKED